MAVKMDERPVREKRAQVWSGMAALMEAAHAEGRSLSVDEAATYDARKAELISLDAELDRIKEYNERSQVDSDIADTRGISVDESKTIDERRSKAFNQYLRRGMSGVHPELRGLLTPGETRAAEYDAGLNEAGFQASGSGGGYLVPTGFWANLHCP
jgi:HK97 family phage major capsid protein